MRANLFFLAVIGAFCAATLAAIGANPRYLEELRIGGGYADAKDGGADFVKNGDIVTDGKIEADGTLSVGKGSSDAFAVLDGGAGFQRTLSLRSNGSDRWQIKANFNAETGSDAGSNFEFTARNDGGGFIDIPIRITRAAGGEVQLGGSTNRVTRLMYNGAVNGDLAIAGGDLDAGADGVTRGIVSAWDGSGGSAPGCIKLMAANGTPYYFFVENDGTFRVSTSLPTSNEAGSIVGLQF